MNKFIIFVIFFIVSSISWAQSLYEISWDSQTNVKYWEVYIEVRQVSTGFILRDDRNYTKIFEQFQVGTVMYESGITRVKFYISLPNSNQYVVAGVIANNQTRSKLGTSKVIKLNTTKTIDINSSNINF